MKINNIMNCKDFNNGLSELNSGMKAFIIVSIILLFTIIVSLPIFLGSYNIFADDGFFHVSRLAGTEMIFKSKEILPLIVPGFCNNFGYGTNIFYSPLTAILPLLFRIFTFDIYAITKIIVILGSFFSGLTMYFFIKKVTDNDMAGIIAAVLFIISPYRLNDAYYRNAIPEYISFIFLPRIFNGLYTIVNKNEKSNLLTIGATLLILTHTLTAFYTAILCFLYLLVNYRKLKDKNVLINLGISILLIILISMFYVGPLLEHKIKGDYVVFDADSMVEFDRMELLKLDIEKLFRPSTIGHYNFTIGYTLFIGIALTVICIKKVLEKEYKLIYLFSLIIGFMLLIISSKLFPYEKMPKLFLMIQFTFRFLELINLLFIIVASINISMTMEKYSIFLLLMVLVILSDIVPIVAISYENIDIDVNLFYNPIPVYEIEKYPSRHLNLAQYEYLPQKALDNTGYIERRGDIPIILEAKDNLEIKNYKKENTSLYFEVSNAKKGDVIELPYIYYLGYRVKVNGKEVDNFESEKGFVAFKLEEDYENAEIQVRYLGTNFMIASYLISLGTIIYLLVDRCTKKIKNKNQNKKE